MRIRSLIVLIGVLVSIAPTAARAELRCADQTPDVHELIDVGPEGTTGRYALPTDDPTTLVAFMHGYGHLSASWVEHMQRTAAHGAVAFATDYRGTTEGRGWWVREGAEEAIAVSLAFLAVCPSITQVIVHGVSMGGNASGLAVAAGATRADGQTPLFDYWVAGEPAANVLETYLEASALAPVNEFAANARDDIEAEHGGPLAEHPESYLEGTVVLRADDIAAGGIKGVAVVHAFDDGLVPYDQGRELTTVLRLNGVPTDFYSVARRETDGDADASDNTTLEDYALGDDDPEPLAGHGTESSQTNIVIQTGLDLVFALIEGARIPAGSEFLVDGEAGIVQLL